MSEPTHAGATHDYRETVQGSTVDQFAPSPTRWERLMVNRRDFLRRTERAVRAEADRRGMYPPPVKARTEGSPADRRAPADRRQSGQPDRREK